MERVHFILTEYLLQQQRTRKIILTETKVTSVPNKVLADMILNAGAIISSENFEYALNNF